MNTVMHKFRVWDKRKKRYDDRYVIDSDGLAYQLVDVGDDWYDLIPNEEVIIEHCIGLRDKSRKLIYVGDIIYYDATPYDVSAPRVIGEVVYCRGGFHLDVKKHLDFEKELQSIQSFLRPTALFEKGIEIIGNIHDGQLREVTKLTEN